MNKLLVIASVLLVTSINAHAEQTPAESSSLESINNQTVSFRASGTDEPIAKPSARRIMSISACIFRLRHKGTYYTGLCRSKAFRSHL